MNMKMKRTLVVIGILLGLSLSAVAQVTPVSQMEKLDRGLVIVPARSTGNFLSWRLLGTDDNSTAFELLKNGEVVATNITGATSMTLDGGANDEFQVATLHDGVRTETSKAVKPWAKSYLELKLDRPEGGVIEGWRPYNSSTKKYEAAINQEYTYSPNDCSVGDVDPQYMA